MNAPLYIFVILFLEAQNLTCSFEKDTCEWQNISAIWIRDQYKYGNPYTGPQTKNGKDGRK
jgi:hypothetical protein